MKLSKQEINRKLLHLIALAIPISIYYVPKLTDVSALIPPMAIGAVLLTLIIVEKLRQIHSRVQLLFQGFFGLLLRKSEEKQITGATYIIGGAFICSVCFIHYPQISFVVLTLFIIGDGAAAIVGLGIGRVSILNKTIEGSLACFIVCLALSCLLYPHLPLLSLDFEKDFSIFHMIFTSLAITLLELIPIKLSNRHIVNDNVFVPPVAGMLLYVLAYHY